MLLSAANFSVILLSLSLSLVSFARGGEITSSSKDFRTNFQVRKHLSKKTFFHLCKKIIHTLCKRFVRYNNNFFRIYYYWKNLLFISKRVCVKKLLLVFTTRQSFDTFNLIRKKVWRSLKLWHQTFLSTINISTTKL